jgi:hypothetical protein
LKAFANIEELKATHSHLKILWDTTPDFRDVYVPQVLVHLAELLKDPDVQNIFKLSRYNLGRSQILEPVK